MAADYEYVTDAQIKESISVKLLNQLADHDGDGVADTKVLASLKRKSVAEVLGYVVLQHPNLPGDVINADSEIPELLRQWIIQVYLYHAYKQNKRAAVPEAVSDDYARLIETVLPTFARTGIPQLVAEPAIEADGQELAGNMSADDLGELTQDGEPLPWSEMP